MGEPVSATAGGRGERNAINVALLGLLHERIRQEIRARYLGEVDE